VNDKIGTTNTLKDTLLDLASRFGPRGAGWNAAAAAFPVAQRELRRIGSGHLGSGPEPRF